VARPAQGIFRHAARSPAFTLIYDNFGVIVRLRTRSRARAPGRRRDGARPARRSFAPFDGYANTGRSKLGGSEVRVFGADWVHLQRDRPEQARIARLREHGRHRRVRRVDRGRERAPRPHRMAPGDGAGGGPEPAARRRRVSTRSAVRSPSAVSWRSRQSFVGGPYTVAELRFGGQFPRSAPVAADRMECPPRAVVVNESMPRRTARDARTCCRWVERHPTGRRTGSRRG
jgi:hypothetical protein